MLTQRDHIREPTELEPIFRLIIWALLLSESRAGKLSEFSAVLVDSWKIAAVHYNFMRFSWTAN